MRRSSAASLASLPPAERDEVLEGLSPQALHRLLGDWRFWARPEQIAPDGDWRTWLYVAGRGAGKTRAGAEWIREKVRAGAMIAHLIAPTAADARDVMVTGISGLLSICEDTDTLAGGKPLGRPTYEPSKRRVVWPNGAQAILFSAEEPERLRGPQCEALWADELAAWSHLETTWDMAMFGLRLGSDPQAMVTTTPKPLPLLKRLMVEPTSVVTRGSTYDNAANLATTFLERMRETYEGTRLGRQELMAEILDDLPGALWARDMIEGARVSQAPELVRVVVAVDPSGTSGGTGDDVGIVVAGKGEDGRVYVLADRTLNASPAEWSAAAVKAYHAFGADCLVAERNFGGAMVESTIRTADPDVAYREVTASRGKAVRAEPVAALYEQGRVSHVGGLPALEDQMMMMGRDGYAGEGSPDRVDALVWAVTELVLKGRSRFQWYVGD